MDISWSSTTGSSLSFKTSETGSGSTTVTSDYESSMGVSSGSGEETGTATVMAVGGDATAVGEETIATGDIDLEIKDMGTTTVASGSATFEASSESDGGDTAYATAVTEVALSPADTIYTWNVESSSTVQTDDVSEWSASSTTGVLALYDDESEDTNSSGSTDTTTAEDDSEGETPQVTGDAEIADLQVDDEPLTAFTLDYDSGNIADLTIDAAAYGQDTFISVDASILTVEDQLSTVYGMVYGAVG
jgi:hypothetical protein